MTWMNPWAWLGIGTLALPVLVHLLARNRARVRRLATLRFVEASPPTSTRPSRITDPLLLLVRLLVLAVAVIALARPHLAEDPASALSQEPPVTRVILVDTGPAMSRLSAEGEPALDVARRRAAESAGASAAADSGGSGPATAGAGGSGAGARAAPEGRATPGPARAGSRHVVEVPGSIGSLGPAADGAAAFLADVPGRREILVYSVFGAGALPQGAELARQLGIPVVLEQVALAPAETIRHRVRHPASESRISSIAGAGGGVRAEWDRVPPPLEALDSLRLAGTAYLAAELSGAPAIDADRPVVLALGAGAFPSADLASSWAGSPEAVGDLLLALQRDAGLGALSRDTRVEAGSWEGLLDASGGGPAAALAISTLSGEPAVLAVPARVAGGPGVIVGTSTGPDALLSSALVSAVGQGAEGTRLRHVDPRVHSPRDVERWNDRFGGREALATPDPGSAGVVDPAEGTGEARVLWGLVLLLLTAEWRLRRRSEATR